MRSTRILEITHFSKDKKPNRLTINDVSPRVNENGFPEEGGYFLRIGDAVFHLSEAEAAHLALTLMETHKQHLLLYRKAAREAAANRGGEE
ncbi:MAG: hypothetical protein ACP5NY_04200 [Thermocladium sp.]